MQTQRTGANGTPAAPVTLSREQRNAICREARKVLLAGSDLAVMAERASQHDRESLTYQDREWLTYHREWVVEFARKLRAASRLLDQLGWLDVGVRDEYTFELDEDVKWFLLRLEDHALGRRLSSADEWWAAESTATVACEAVA
jgi:hypothetical protein